jgi:CRP-like cAMP-binding protein
MALIDQGPRSATVETLTPMRLLVLDPRAFSTLMAEHRSVASKILQALVERLRNVEGAPRWAASG